VRNTEARNLEGALDLELKIHRSRSQLQPCFFNNVKESLKGIEKSAVLRNAVEDHK
jgi:hypothetical protein